ncbi:threonine dehydratase [Segniliparus rotundus DSM 44985]|uniref:L-threonine dehydratase biosynthetic IlvA n=1 Tax=Segniliparus rotundus (strain ATCC BAA-972 / CDC 1076 / CIP 108378 / DSM 44985 / JCM 13578) TaxID=640132 RepID=D6ZF80_SEGRD|nr:threonine dehydratase [Segniliparus rotundus DSM 44985]
MTAADVDAAAARLSGVADRTPLQRDRRLSAQFGVELYLKREDLQVVRSYKLRGAYNLMSQLSHEEKAAGVVTASAGNHAQGVAYACHAMGVFGRIYVPNTTPRQKRDRIRAHGGDFIELISTGDNYDAAAHAAHADADQTGATLVPSFNDPRTAAGQGTIAKEILEQLAACGAAAFPDVVVVPVGGGGCVAGIAAYLAERSAQTAVLAVEPAGAACLAAALVAGAPVTLPAIDPFVDGAAVRRVGDVAHRVLSALGAKTRAAPNTPLLMSGADSQRAELSPGSIVVTQVDEGALCTTILDLYQNGGIIAEPAGALAVAALDQVRLPAGATVVSLISGGNNDVSRYGEILERSLVHKGLKHYFLVDFPQEPGALRRFLEQVLGAEDDITVFEYIKRDNRELGAALVGIELGQAADLGPLMERMDRSGLSCERLLPGTAAYRYLT